MPTTDWEQFAADKKAPTGGAGGDQWEQYASPYEVSYPIGPHKPPTPGYFSELWNQSGIPSLAEGMRTHPLDTLGRVVAGIHLLPTLQDVGNMQDTIERSPQAAAAAGTLAFAPLAVGAESKLPIGEMAAKANAVGKGVMKGAALGSVDARTVPLGYLGEALGEKMGHPGLGLALGAAPTMAKNIWDSIQTELGALPKTYKPMPPRMPNWAGMPEGARALPDFNPAQGVNLPSGRIPGQPMPGEINVDLNRRLPMWKAVGSEATPSTLPDVTPIPGKLPSGRVAGTPAPQPTSISMGPRQPAWAGMTEPTPSVIPEVSPIPGKLPSGRIPGKPTASKAAPIQAAPVPTVAAPPTAAVGAAAGAETPNLGLTAPLSPAEQKAVSMNPQARWSDSNRMLHATVQELELPGSPAGKRAPGMVSDMAKNVYGAKSARDLTPEQLDSLNDFIVTHKRLPNIGEIK